MVISYSPEDPASFNFYDQTPSSKTQRNIFGGQKQVRATFEPLFQQPTSLPVKLLRDIAPQVHHGLNNAVGEVGGIGAFLFLFGKVGRFYSREVL